MPTYEYECKKCGPFEQFQPITAKPLRTCPTCKGRVKRLIGAGGGFIFKGSGFYQTDYRSKSYTDAAKKDSGDSGGAAKETKKESVPASKETKKEAAPAAKETKTESTTKKEQAKS